ncbi:SUMO1 sentrin specific peptidase 1 [Homalodisca vitripennis]|nr:SUMO1 sentrin specific peptidase 1 [Homalodisca vitripennis]
MDVIRGPLNVPESAYASLLRKGAMVNDLIVSGFLRLIERRSLLQPNLPKVWSFDTFFFVAWIQGGYPRVKRWTKGINILQRDIVFFPVHIPEEQHWVLVVARPKLNVIQVFDSLNKPRPKLVEVVFSYIKEFAKNMNFPIEEDIWLFQNNAPCAQQNNNTDCGVYVCMFADQISQNQAVLGVPFDPYLYRRSVASTLRKSSLLGKTDFTGKESDKDFSAVITNPRDCRLPSAQPETSELTVCFPEGRQTVVTAWDPMLEALKEAIDNNYEGNESSITFSNPPDREVKNAISTCNRTECLSGHEMDELRKESGPTPDTSHQDVNIQKEAAAEDDFEMVNECDVTLSRASSPCLSIMEDSEWVDNELAMDSSTNCITTNRDTPQPIQPPPPEKTEAPEEIKHVLDCSLNVRNVQAASNKQKRYRPKRIRVFNPDGTFVRIDVRKLPPELR